MMIIIEIYPEYICKKKEFKTCLEDYNNVIPVFFLQGQHFYVMHITFRQLDVPEIIAWHWNYVDGKG